jgi:hypothetical protein
VITGGNNIAASVLSRLGLALPRAAAGETSSAPGLDAVGAGGRTAPRTLPWFAPASLDPGAITPPAQSTPPRPPALPPSAVDSVTGVSTYAPDPTAAPDTWGASGYGVAPNGTALLPNGTDLVPLGGGYVFNPVTAEIIPPDTFSPVLGAAARGVSRSAV